MSEAVGILGLYLFLISGEIAHKNFYFFPYIFINSLFILKLHQSLPHIVQ